MPGVSEHIKNKNMQKVKSVHGDFALQGVCNRRTTPHIRPVVGMADYPDYAQPMSRVRLLFAPESIGVADRIAAALTACKYTPSYGNDPAAAVLVVWSAAANASRSILSDARAALARRVLVPVALGKAPPPPSFEHLWPMDLLGWDGAVDDPRWKFVLDEIELAVRQGVEIGAAPLARNPDTPVPKSNSIAAAPLEARADAACVAAFEDIFAEPQSYAVASYPRPRIPFAAVIAGFALLGVASGGAFIAGRESSRTSSGASNAADARPVVALVHPKDQPADDTIPNEPVFPKKPAERAVEPAAEIPDETVTGEGDAEFAEEGGQVASAAQSLRDGAARSAIEMLPPVDPAASAASSELTSEAEEPARETRDDEPDAIAELAWNATSDVETPQFGRYFRDCVECPDMAEIEPGVLTPDVNEDSLATPVMLRKRIAVAVKETTFEEWAACVADGACSPAPDSGWGTGKQPVINVSWGDALAFVLWLSEKTGHSYRLPTESEWEFAARGGSPTAFSFGAAAAADKANFDATRPDGGPAGAVRGRPLPVASFAANAFGLYDMHGNIAEWTADCWTGDAEGIVTVSGGECSARVVKGGAWNDGGSELRASNREGDVEDARRNDLGFRVVRDLP